MSAVASLDAPCLGASIAACNQLLGLPVRIDADDGALLRRYFVGEQTLTVCFDHGHAVAFRVDFHDDCWPFTAAGLQPRDFQPQPEAPRRLLIEDLAWAVATQECPYRLIRAAAGM
jgi:hypothetical protein